MSEPAPIQVAIELAQKFAYVPGEVAATSDGAEAFTEQILFGQQREYRFQIFQDGAAFDLTGWQFRLALGAAVQYNDAGDIIAAVVVAQNDVADFSIDGPGELSCGLDCNTDEFLDVITSPDVGRFATGRAELWGRPSALDPWEPFAQWPIQLQGSVFDVTQTPGTSASSYYTAAQMDLKLGPTLTLLVEGTKVVLRESGNQIATWDLPA